MTWLKNRRCQVSLRSTLVLFCVVCSVIAYFSHLKKRQVQVQKIVLELGGWVNNVDFEDGRAIASPRMDLVPDCFYLFLPERYNYVYVPFPKVDDDRLEQILQLPGIEGLNISCSRITDKGLVMLAKKSGWKELQLYDIPTVTKEALFRLEASTTCRVQHDHGAP